MLGDPNTARRMAQKRKEADEALKAAGLVEFEALLFEGDRPGGRRRVRLIVDGEERTTDRVALDATRSKAEVAHRWSQVYGIDQTRAIQALNALAVEDAKEIAECRRQVHAQGPPPRMSDIAGRFVASLQPEWHRAGKTLYLEAIGREVKVPELWTLADDGVFDSMTLSREALELSREGIPPPRQHIMSSIKDAIRVAATKEIAKLPEHDDVEIDQTTDPDRLMSRIAGMLLRPRSFVGETGERMTGSYLDWALGLATDANWHRCFGHPVFGRRETPGAKPEIAVSGEHLTEELRAESKRRLLADLRSCKLADTDARVRCDGTQWRSCLINSHVLDSICETESDSEASQASQQTPLTHQKTQKNGGVT